MSGPDTARMFTPGMRIAHPELGAGVVLEALDGGYLRVFFSIGERRVPVLSIRRELSRTERVLRAVEGDAERARKLWLCLEAHALPIMESAAALTSAKIDLLPHQVVLTHRIATASPRRFLVADEVGLGKTIETALILRELASRGELARALMVVFDLFQDLGGFSLDDYQPFSDMSSSMDRLVRFMSAAVTDRQQRLVKIDEQTYDLMLVDGARRARFTLNRDSATSRDDLELMGLDQPLVQEELGRWRSLAPEELGVAVEGDVDGVVLLSFWMVEASAGNGERRVVVQAIAVKQDGTRVPAIEYQFERYF